MTSPKPPFRDPGIPRGAAGSSWDPQARRQESPECLPDALACPFCEGTETEIMNAFGSHASVATYWCRACRSPFEALKWRG